MAVYKRRPGLCIHKPGPGPIFFGQKKLIKHDLRIRPYLFNLDDELYNELYLIFTIIIIY